MKLKSKELVNNDVFRRIVSAIMVVMLFVSSLSVAGAEPVALPVAEAGNAAGQPGDTVAVAVYIDPGEEGFWKYAMELEYDASVLELADQMPVQDEALAASFAADTASEAGSILVRAEDFESIFIDSRQKMLTIYFKVKEAALAGESQILISNAEYTMDTVSVPIDNRIAGTVTIQAPVLPVTNEEVTIKIGKVNGKAGDHVTVPVSVADSSTAIGSYGMKINYDSTALELLSISGRSDELFASQYNQAEGWLMVGWADITGGDHSMRSNNLLFNIEFQIGQSAELGEKPLTIRTGDLLQFTVTDIAALEMTKTLVAGSVTVVADASGGTDGNGSGDSSTPVQSPPVIVEVFVNGKSESAGTAKSGMRNGQKTMTIVVDRKKLEERLAGEKPESRITIPVNTDSQVVIAELTAGMIQKLADKQAIIELRTSEASYMLPAEQISFLALQSQPGSDIDPEQAIVQIEIALPTEDELAIVNHAADAGGFTLAGQPLNFAVRAIYGDKTVEFSKFGAYVERSIVIPDGVNPDRITTGIVVEQDGSVRHVPTKIVLVEGTYYANVNSVTNSTYALVWHPAEFQDVSQHWAREAVNDMASRMVVSGNAQGRYLPEQEVSRAEFAAMMIRALGLKAESGAASYTDVNASDWYSAAVETAYAYHLMQGFADGTFRPMDQITREQAMVVIAKAMTLTRLKDKLPAQDSAAALRSYRDVTAVSSWALSGIADSVQAGIVSGRSGNLLAPKQTMTRAEAAAIVRGLLQKSELI
jgi:hypothetical protein